MGRVRRWQSHRGIIVTAGHAATGNAIAVLGRQRGLPAIIVVRSETARAALRAAGCEHVIVRKAGFTASLAELSETLGTTAVFDGVGGQVLSDVATAAPVNSTIWCYGFLDAASPVSFPTALLMAKSFIIRRFSNFETPTVRDPMNLETALQALERVIDDPLSGHGSAKRSLTRK